MFQHILIPTGGSELPYRAVAGVLDFARVLDACLTAYTCLEEYPYTPLPKIVVETPQVFKERIGAQAHTVLKDMENTVVGVDVRCDTDMSCFAVLCMSIINVVEHRGRDVISTAPHSRHGLAGLLLGSEAQKVLAHIEIPVIVYR